MSPVVSDIDQSLIFDANEPIVPETSRHEGHPPKRDGSLISALPPSAFAPVFHSPRLSVLEERILLPYVPPWPVEATPLCAGSECRAGLVISRSTRSTHTPYRRWRSPFPNPPLRINSRESSGGRATAASSSYPRIIPPLSPSIEATFFFFFFFLLLALLSHYRSRRSNLLPRSCHPGLITPSFRRVEIKRKGPETRGERGRNTRRSFSLSTVEWVGETDKANFRCPTDFCLLSSTDEFLICDFSFFFSLEKCV